MSEGRGSVARATLVVLALTTAAIGGSAARAAITHDVTVGPGNAFTPKKAEIEVGDSVRWTINETGHTVTANDGRFDQDGLAEGETFVWGPFTEDETFIYRCKVHAEMFGVIEVGEGSPLPPPGQPSEIRRVCRDACDPGEYASVGAAMAGALPRARIELEPGIYDEPIVLAIPGLVVRGIGATPEDVLIDAGGSRFYGVELFGDQTAIEHVAITDAGLDGVRASEADGFAVVDVVTTDNGRSGVMVEGARGGSVRRTTATGHRLAGFALTACRSCDTVFEEVEATGNYIGLDANDAGGVVVSGSRFADNGAGIVLRTTWTAGDTLDEHAPQRGSHILGNTIEGNVVLDGPRPAIGAESPLRSGAGIWINAGSFNLVENNHITGHHLGVVVTGLVGASNANRIVGNTVGDSGAADLAWDGIGAGTCFAGNTGDADDAPTYEPPFAAAAYDCGLPATVGIPYPPVDAALVLWSPPQI